MKLLFVVFVSALALSATDPQSKDTKARKETAKTPANAAVKVTDGSKQLAIPADAVQGPDGDFHYTDPQGKKWIYRKTPFGPARLEDTPEASSKAAAPSSDGIKATEDGDKVRFERPGPFGVWKWEKKKSELDDSEKAAFERSQTKTAAKQD